MSTPLVVRNLTSGIICLERIEVYDKLIPVAHGSAQFVTSIFSWGQKAALAALDGQQTPWKTIESNLQINAFQSVNGPESYSDHIQRLIFEINGQHYHLDVPLPKPRSNYLTRLKLHDNASPTVSAIYSASDNALSLLPASIGRHAWMSPLPDVLPLSAISIPGTHNSHAHYRALPSVRCQAVDVPTQLANGVRFLDVRVQPLGGEGDEDKEDLVLVHGAFPVSLGRRGSKLFRPLVENLLKFLEENPGECLVLSVKREGMGNHTDHQLARILRKFYCQNGDDQVKRRWWLEPRIPSLGEARGKIVLMRRFRLDKPGQSMHGGRGWGINAEHWAHNTEHDVRGGLVVQDYFSVLSTRDIARKIELSCAQLGRSSAYHSSTITPSLPNVTPQVPLLHLNFLSGSNFWNVSCWPGQIAAKVNPAVLQHMCVKPIMDKCCTGVVVLDFVGIAGDWDLVKMIIGMNAKLMSD